MNEQLETSNPLTRTERQKEILKKWIINKCKGTAVCCTGFGFVEAVPIEESSELLSGNIGESPNQDNTEINSEITKGSESSYSVESE
jgi:hypothetical protein